jgi:hypothetical protein
MVEGAVSVAPRPLLLVYGLADTRLLPSCARQISQWADEPKELVFLSWGRAWTAGV